MAQALVPHVERPIFRPNISVLHTQYDERGQVTSVTDVRAEIPVWVWAVVGLGVGGVVGYAVANRLSGPTARPRLAAPARPQKRLARR